jgi:predicted secreted hydrolase
MMRRIAAAFAALALAVATPPPASAQFASAGLPYVFHFPRDAGAHPAFRVEWWYVTGNLQTEHGRRFGYELTLFRVGLRPGDPRPRAGESRWRGNQVYPAHFALTDAAGRRFLYAERFEREALGMGGAARANLAAHAGDWTLRAVSGGSALHERLTLHAAAQASGAPIAIDLAAISQKVPAVHGHGGVSRKGACPTCASHYYSLTRLRTSGTVRVGVETFAVSGASWLDHEFGSGELDRDEVGWDWFCAQLADGRELMLYRLRTAGGAIVAQSSGSVIGRDGRVTYLARDDAEVTALGTWRSPHTGARYPSGWHVSVPRAGIDVTVAPLIVDQELALQNGPSYWEGAVDLRDRSGRAVGSGYVELTGYAGTVRL